MSRTIVLVEDDGVIRKWVRTVLLAEGYQVIEAEDGEQGLKLAEDHRGPIDLLLTAVAMPRRTGPELAKRLLSSRADLKVIYMSGPVDHTFARSMLGESATIVQKPLTQERLVQNVREVLATRKGYGARAP